MDVRIIWRDPFERGRIANGLRFLSPVPIVMTPLPEMVQAVRNILSRNTFDAVVASTGVTATYALVAPQRTAKVLEEHNSLSRWMEERFRMQSSVVQRARCWISWQKARYHESRLFRRFDLCLMVSEQDREASQYMLPGYHGAVEVVPNGVDCRHNYPGLVQPKPNTLIFNGALSYYANYDAIQYFLAEIYPLIREHVPDVSLTVTGSSSDIDLSKLRLDESVHLSGWVDDIRPLVAGAWICVVPIRTGGGTRLKVLEAMALGTPVIATSKGVEGLAVTPGQDVLIADQPAEFADQVVHLLQDRTLRQRLVTKARDLVERQYDWAQIGQRFAELIEDIAG
jgi:glycosyltransferase involved in cell wall biosynthesis